MEPNNQNEVCPFRKGDRVEMTSTKDGITYHGVVKSTHLKGDRMSMTADDGTVRSWGWKNFRRSDKPMPAREINPFRIGDRVAWTQPKKGDRCGKVIAVTEERIKVVPDDDIYSTISGRFGLFCKTDKPEPKREPEIFIRTDPPMALDLYSVRGYKETGGEEGGFSAIITYRNTPVGKIFNGGFGGPTETSFEDETFRKGFLGSLKLAWRCNGGKDEDYKEDCFADVWAHWVAVMKVRGRYLWQEVEEMQGFSDKCRKEEKA